MSLSHGYFDVSGTEIAVKGIRNKTSLFFALLALCIPIPLWQLTSYIHQDHLCLQRSSLPSSCLSITRVSALLPNGVLPHGDDSCRLLAHSFSFDYWLASCYSTVFSGRYLLHSACSVTTHFCSPHIVSLLFMQPVNMLLGVWYP